MFFMSASSSGSDLSELLSNATSMFTWFITQMTALAGFIVDNPIVLTIFLVFLVGAVVGMFMRVWKSV